MGQDLLFKGTARKIGRAGTILLLVLQTGSPQQDNHWTSFSKIFIAFIDFLEL
jgi:hypothetical protein